MPEESDIKARIEEIMGAELGLSPAQLDDATAVSDTNITSLEFAEMVFRIEEEFGVTIDAIDVPVVETVGELKQYVVGLASGTADSSEATA